MLSVARTRSMRLVDEYRAENRLRGHAERCAVGAGGDCTCGVTPPCWADGCAFYEGTDEDGCQHCRPEDHPQPAPEVPDEDPVAIADDDYIPF